MYGPGAYTPPTNAYGATTPAPNPYAASPNATPAPGVAASNPLNTTPPAAGASNIYDSASPAPTNVASNANVYARGDTWSNNGPPAHNTNGPAILESAQQIANNAAQTAQSALDNVAATANTYATRAQNQYDQAATKIEDTAKDIYAAGANAVNNATAGLIQSTETAQGNFNSAVQQAGAIAENIGSHVQEAVYDAGIPATRPAEVAPATAPSVYQQPAAATAWRPGSTTTFQR